jgi:uncharacterized protein (DUF4415 family)
LKDGDIRHDADSPSTKASDWEGAVVRRAGRKVGTVPARGRPRKADAKIPVKLRLDPDIVAALRATGEGWQTRVNDSLRAWIKLGTEK